MAAHVAAKAREHALATRATELEAKAAAHTAAATIYNAWDNTTPVVEYVVTTLPPYINRESQQHNTYDTDTDTKQNYEKQREQKVITHHIGPGPGQTKEKSTMRRQHLTNRQQQRTGVTWRG